MPKGVYLGFDYGTHKIGVAVGQSVSRSATILPQLITKRLNLPWKELDRLIEVWQPEALVVGIPHTFTGEDFPVTNLAKEFMRLLAERYKLPVHGMEELLTTKAAREVLFNDGGFRALQKESVDSYAAKLILENWLHDHRLGEE